MKFTCSTPSILMKTSQRYYGTSKRHMTFTLLLINSLSQIFYLMSAMPSEGLNAKHKRVMLVDTLHKWLYDGGNVKDQSSTSEIGD